MCRGAFAAARSQCGGSEPLLEKWAREEGCTVRKEAVAITSKSRSWGKQGWLKRPSLSHMFRRHIRYYAAHRCNKDSQVCLTFKDEVDEQWVAGVNSTDGVNFLGAPALVMPRFSYREVLYTELLSQLTSGVPAPPDVRSDLRQRLACDAQASNATLINKTAARTYCDHCLPENATLVQRVQVGLGSMTHNLAMAFHRGEWYAVGGRHNGLDDFNQKESAYLVPESKGTVVTSDWWVPTVSLLQGPLKERMSSTPSGDKHRDATDELKRVMYEAVGVKTTNALRSLPYKARHIPRKGIWMMRGKSWRYDEYNGGVSGNWLSPDNMVIEPPRAPWHGKRLIIDGNHPGCVERRDNAHLCPNTCEYDGRFSLVSFKGALLLYTRSNPKSHGSRHVQMTRSVDDGATWSPFEQLTFDGYEGGGDIYFFGVQVNPAHSGSLIAVFPLVHRLRGCIGMAASVDGARWTRITPLLSCKIYGERTMHQPALPAMVRSGNDVWMYVQEEVPGITVDQRTPRFSYAQMVGAEKASGLTRYAFPCSKLALWTKSTLQGWASLETAVSDACESTASASVPQEPSKQSKSVCRWADVASASPAPASQGSKSSTGASAEKMKPKAKRSKPKPNK